MKIVDRQLLAYICFENSGWLFIDVVETTKNGLSYRYEGELWNRGFSMLNRDLCTNQKGQKCKIIPLSRHYTPEFAQNIKIEIASGAIARYTLWTEKKLKPPPLPCND